MHINKKSVVLGVAGAVLALSLFAPLLQVFQGTASAASETAAWRTTDTGQRYVNVNGTSYYPCTSNNCVPTNSAGAGPIDNSWYFPNDWVNLTGGSQFVNGQSSPINTCTASNLASDIGKSVVQANPATNTGKIQQLVTPYTVSNGHNTSGKLCLGIASGPQQKDGPNDFSLSFQNNGLDSGPQLTGTWVTSNIIKLDDGSLYAHGSYGSDSTAQCPDAYYSAGGACGRLINSQHCATAAIKDLSADKKTGKLYSVNQALITGRGGGIVCSIGTATNIVNLDNTNANKTYAWTSPKTIKASTGQGPDFTQTADGANTFTATDKNNSCTITLTVAALDSTKSTTGTFSAKTTRTNSRAPNGGCGATDGYPTGTVNIGALNTDSGVAVPAAPGATGNNTQTCESSGFSLSWIVCAIVNGLSEAVDGIYGNFVVPMLTISSLGAAGDPNNPTYTTWTFFRTLGDVFLVIALLIIVFGESFGGGLIDAYTAKKVLPRLLIAGILINLSYYICAGLVDIFNILGRGLMDLLASPFTHQTGFGIKLGGAGTDHGLVGSGGTGIGSDLGIVALIGLGWGAANVSGALLGFLWAFVLLPALLIFISIVVTIFLRRALVIILVAVSPVAFALYCLPNTEKYFKKWWSAFTETLMVFPIITVLFAAGKIAAVVIPATTSGLGTGVAAIIAVVALIVPLALIPFAFKLAGGILGKAHDTLNSYGKRGHQAALGNANDPTSWRNRARTRMAGDVADYRKTVYDKGVGNAGGGTRVGGFLQRKIGGRNSAAKQALYNEQQIKAHTNTFANGDDTYARASTVDYEGINRDLKSTDTATRAAAESRVVRNADDSIGGYVASDGASYTKAQISEGRKIYNTRAAQQAAFRRVMEKSENATDEQQDYIKQDFGAYGSRNNISDDDLNGDFASVTIPNQRMRQDIRYTTFKGDPKNGFTAKTNAAKHNASLATQQGFAIAAQSPGTMKALATQSVDPSTGEYVVKGTFQEEVDTRDTLRAEATAAAAAGRADEAAAKTAQADVIHARLHATKDNLEKFLGTSTVTPPAGGVATPTFGGASSASAKSEQAAQAALNAIRSISPEWMH